jgi:GntR family transcriptional regulator
MSDQRPLHQQIRNHIVAIILDERMAEEDPLPSVRALAAEVGANPLTVAKGYAALQEAGFVAARRGIGFFVTAGGRARLKEAERVKFLDEEWPSLKRKIKILNLRLGELLEERRRPLTEEPL